MWRGYAHQEWQKMRERNEALDTRIYARAAAWILGADRFDERMWRQLTYGSDAELAAAASDIERRIAALEKPGRSVLRPYAVKDL
jgi:phage terminase large subunit GpA-like protein